MSPDLFAAIVVLKPPMLDANRFEERLNGKLVVRLAGDGLTHEGGVSQGMCRIAAATAGIESEPGRSRVTGVSENVLPGTIIRRTGRLRANARGMIEQLFDSDVLLAGITERNCPRDEPECGVVEGHSHRCA